MDCFNCGSEMVEDGFIAGELDLAKALLSKPELYRVLRCPKCYPIQQAYELMGDGPPVRFR